MTRPGSVVAGMPLWGDDGFFAKHRAVVLLVLTIIEVAVLVVLFARWFARTRGWRRSVSRLRGYVSGGFRDLAEPVAAWVRFRRGVRLVAGQLLDPELATSCEAAFSHAEAALAGNRGCRPYLVAVSSTDVEIGISGRTPTPPGQPWRVNPGGRWALGRAELLGGFDGARRPPAPPFDPSGHSTAQPAPLEQQEYDHTASGPRIAVGVAADALVLVDLAALPGVGVIEGPEAACRRFACAVAAQLAAGLTGPAPVRLVVADGILPWFSAPRLADSLDDLENSGDENGRDGNGTVRTVLVCAQPTPHEAERIAGLVECIPGLHVLVAGDYPDTRWRLVLDDSGMLAAPELGFEADAAPLERGIGQAVRQRREIPVRVGVPAPGVPAPEEDGEPPSPGSGVRVPALTPAPPPLPLPPPPLPPPPLPLPPPPPLPLVQLPPPPPVTAAARVGAFTEPNLAEPAPREYTDADMAPAVPRGSRTGPDPDDPYGSVP